MLELAVEGGLPGVVKDSLALVDRNANLFDVSVSLLVVFDCFALVFGDRSTQIDW